MATQAVIKKCPECGTKDPKAREAGGLHCLPLEQRRGPSINDPAHPTNSGAADGYMAAVASFGARHRGRIYGPYTGDGK